MAVACGSAHAGLFTQRFADLNLTVPDGSTTGVSDTRWLSPGSGVIANVEVSLELEGGYTGDLYALLMHDGNSAVLLNRLGRSDSDPLGYADSGLNVVFSDAAPSDVHRYRWTIGGSDDVPLGTPLTGLWQPDARRTDPDQVVPSTPRSAFLDTFRGKSGTGDWTLFVADLSPVGESVLKSWSLSITSVPEPRSMLITCVCLGLARFGIRLQRGRKSSTESGARR